MSHCCGWIPDVEDQRDQQYGIRGDELEVSTSPSADLRWQMGSVLNQGSLGSCVSQAIAKGVYAAHARQGLTAPEPISRLAIYYLARAVISKQSYNAGCHIRDAFKMMVRFGFCPESLWPYDDHTGIGARFRQMPPTKAFQGAYDQRATGGKPVVYRRILDLGSERVETVRRMLMLGMPVIFGTKVSEDFADDDLPSGPIPPPIGQSIAGGHAMVIAGFGDGYVDVMNSWGTSWGDNGWCRLSDDYIAWEQTSDLWTVDVAPSFGGPA